MCASHERKCERLTARCSGLLALWDSWSSWWLSSLSRSCRSHTIHSNTFFFSPSAWSLLRVLLNMPKVRLDLKTFQHVNSGTGSSGNLECCRAGLFTATASVPTDAQGDGVMSQHENIIRENAESTSMCVGNKEYDVFLSENSDG